MPDIHVCYVKKDGMLQSVSFEAEFDQLPKSISALTAFVEFLPSEFPICNTWLLEPKTKMWLQIPNDRYFALHMEILGSEHVPIIYIKIQ